MNISQIIPSNHDQTQQLYRQYGSNALLPDIQWNELFQSSALTPLHIQALNTLYHSAVPLALQVFDALNFDVFSPTAYKPQGLGLFERLAEQEEKLIQVLVSEAAGFSEAVRYQIWSMLLRGGAVLVFKAWLGKVKTHENRLDISQFDELSDLLFIKTSPIELAQHLHINPHSPQEHMFLMYDDEVYLERFNSLETAALFVELGVYDAAFLSLHDDSVAAYLKEKDYVSQEQIDDLHSALNPLFCTDLTPKRSCVA